MESLKQTLALLPDLPKDFDMVPASSGMAVTTLGDCYRTPMVKLPPSQDTHFKRITTKTANLLVFEDGTGLIEKDDIIFPAPLTLANSIQKTNIDWLAHQITWIEESDIYHTPYGPKFYHNLLVPAYKPLTYKPTNDEKTLLHEFGQSLLYVLHSLHPVTEICHIRWNSQPITPWRTLAEPNLRLYPKHPLKDRQIVKKAEADAQQLLTHLKSMLPALPGQSLRDGKPKRIPMEITQPPPMTSAHEKLAAETLPFVSTIRQSHAWQTLTSS